MPLHRRERRQTMHQIKWKKSDVFSNPLPVNRRPIYIMDSHPELGDLNPFELFRHYLDDELLDKIASQSNLYARQKNNVQFSMTVSDVLKLSGIVLLSGYHSLPQQEMYWSQDEDIRVDLVASSMSRNRFRDLKRYIHFADNQSLNQNDKMAKIRPLLDATNSRLIQFGVFAENLSIDEQMLPYTGRHSAKQFMHNKPVKFGYKLWSLASSNGYPFHIDVYSGKGNSPLETTLGEHVVLKLVDIVDDVTQHTITFDNYFTSYNLLKSLKEKGIRATGTIRENRMAKAPIMESSAMKKKQRGVFEYFLADDDVLIVKWNDNKPVTLATNYDSVNPLSTCKRFSQSEKKYVSIDQPNIVRNYNALMGGVDLVDRALSNYRPMIRGKKWYFPFFSHCINIFVVASWRIHRELGGKLSQLDFLRYICRSLLKCEVRQARPGPQGDPVPDVRFDNIGHSCTKAVREGRCKQCKKNTFFCCHKCNVKLHQKCFFTFHTNK